MNNIISGLILMMIGILLGLLTFKKYRYFWNFIETRLVRKLLGDFNTSKVLYIVSTVFIITGLLLSLNIIK